jgi:hypothetical protein
VRSAVAMVMLVMDGRVAKLGGWEQWRAAGNELRQSH